MAAKASNGITMQPILKKYIDTHHEPIDAMIQGYEHHEPSDTMIQDYEYHDPMTDRELQHFYKARVLMYGDGLGGDLEVTLEAAGDMIEHADNFLAFLEGPTERILSITAKEALRAAIQYQRLAGEMVRDVPE